MENNFKYPIDGFIVLTGACRPLLATGSSSIAHDAVQMLSKKHPGQDFSILSCDSYMTTQTEPKESKAEQQEVPVSYDVLEARVNEAQSDWCNWHYDSENLAILVQDLWKELKRTLENR